MLKEGHMKKGGLNKKPSIPRPKEAPKGQKIKNNSIEYERDIYRQMLIEIRIMAANAKPIQRKIMYFIDNVFYSNDCEE